MLRSLGLSFVILFYLSVIMLSLPIGQSMIVTNYGEFDNVYVILKDRSDAGDGWYILELEVIGEYQSENGEEDFLNGEMVYFLYNRTVNPKYHELDEGQVMKIDCSLLAKKTDKIIWPTDHSYSSKYIIDIQAMEETSVPPSLWKYYTPPIVIWTIIAAVIVLVIMIVLAIYLRIRIKKTKAMLANDDRSDYDLIK
jgi:hypothetical protein